MRPLPPLIKNDPLTHPFINDIIRLSIENMRAHLGFAYVRPPRVFTLNSLDELAEVRARLIKLSRDRTRAARP